MFPIADEICRSYMSGDTNKNTWNTLTSTLWYFMLIDHCILYLKHLFFTQRQYEIAKCSLLAMIVLILVLLSRTIMLICSIMPEKQYGSYEWNPWRNKFSPLGLQSPSGMLASKVDDFSDHCSSLLQKRETISVTWLHFAQFLKELVWLFAQSSLLLCLPLCASAFVISLLPFFLLMLS